MTPCPTANRIIVSLRPSRRPGGAVVTTVLTYISERVFRLALAAIVGVFVARYLGPERLGLLSFAGGTFGLLTPLTALGLPSLLVREFSTKDEWRPFLASALAIQVPVALFAAVVGMAVVIVARDFARDAVLLAVVLAPLPFLTTHLTLRSYFEATGGVRRIAVTGMVAGVVGAGWRLSGLGASAPVWFFGAAGSIEAAALLVGLALGVPGRRRVAALRRHFRRNVARRLLDESWPLLLAAVAVTIYMKSDLLMLGLIAGDEETGLYTAAARLSEVWYFIPIAAAAAIRPRLARMFAARREQRYLAATQRFMTALVGVAVLAAALVLLAADLIIQFLYGTDFSPAGPVLRVHVLAAPFVFLGVAGSQWFIDRGLTQAVMRRSTVGAVLNVVLNLALIPSQGAMGASIATLTAYAVSGVLLNGVTRQTRPLFGLQVRSFVLRWPTMYPPEGEQSETTGTED